MATNVKKPPDFRVKIEDARSCYADGLYTAKPYEDGPEKFQGTFAMAPDNPAIEQIEAAVDAACKARWGDNKKNWPKRIVGIHEYPVVKSCADYPKMGKFPPGWCFVRARSSDAPGIVGPDVTDIAKQDLRSECYSGRHINASVQAFTYDRVTSKGVSLGLGNVQLAEHDERLGAARPKPEDEFDPTQLPDADADDSEDDDDLTPPPRRRR